MTVCLLALLPVLPAFAQDDYALFREKAGEAALLYRGQKAFVYNIIYNGTYYWTDPMFRPGSVNYRGKTYEDVPLNIDAVRQELLVRLPTGIIEKIVDGKYTPEFSIEGSRFLNLRLLYGEEMPAGYWKVLYDGPVKFLCCVKKHLEQDLDNSKRDMTGYSGPFRPKVFQAFIQEVSYGCLLIDGSFVPIRRRRDLLRLFEPSLRREIRRHVGRDVYGNVIPLERFCPEALKYVESL